MNQAAGIATMGNTYRSGSNTMGRFNRTVIRVSTAGIVSAMALAISAANAQEAGAQVIGKVNAFGAPGGLAQLISSIF